MARIARISSRMRAAGRDHGMEKRFWMWARIWEPRPRMKRPPEYWFRSWPIWARFMGLRAKATAMEVSSWMRSVCSAARSSGKKGSLAISAESAPS